MSEMTPELRKKLTDFLIVRFKDFSKDSLYYDLEGYSDTVTDLALKCEADDWNNGCSKLVFWYNEYPGWLVKVPMFGDKYLESDESSDYVYANYEYFYDQLENNYCERESNNYAAAVKLGLGNMFAGTHFITSVGEIPIYVSEYMQGDAYFDSCSGESLTTAEEILYSRDSLEEEFKLSPLTLGTFIEDYGIQKVEKLLQFLEDREINDLHEENVRLDNEGKIRFIDYSGYYC